MSITGSTTTGNEASSTVPAPVFSSQAELARFMRDARELAASRPAQTAE
jgi:hypothetical protein